MSEELQPPSIAEVPEVQTIPPPEKNAENNHSLPLNHPDSSEVQSEAEKPSEPSDQHGNALQPGDQVVVKATFLEQAGEVLKFIINAGTEIEQVFELFGHGVTRTASTRIGAAPMLRTPVIEIPHPLGGVVPVPKNSAQADEFRQTGKVTTPIQGLPTASPIAAALEGDPKPLQDSAPSPSPSLGLPQ